LEVLLLRVVVSFSFSDIELIKKFQGKIKPRDRSKIVEFLIKEFLKKKNPEKASILFQVKSKHPTTKKESLGV